MAVVAYALPLNEISLADGVIFLLLFAQVNIAVITIRRIYGDKLEYGFKTPFFPIIPIMGVILKLGVFGCVPSSYSTTTLGNHGDLGYCRFPSLSNVHFQERNRCLCTYSY